MNVISDFVASDEYLNSRVAADTLVAEIVASSADLKPDGLFFAISGAKVDGHQFVREAVEKQAAAVVVEREDIFLAYPNTILVRSTREALAKAAARKWGNPSGSFRLVGVTGTNGKTTTTFLLNEIWKKNAKVPALVGTVAYRLGHQVLGSKLTTPGPLELQKLFADMRDSGVTDAAIEVSSIALDQARVLGSAFDAAVFTNLTQDHLDYHGTLEAYYLAKRKLFTDYRIPVGVFNIDDPWGARLLGESKTDQSITFSLKDANADFFLSELILSREGMSGQLQTPWGKKVLSTQLLGKHNVYNCLAALAVATKLGTEADLALEALKNAKGAPGRLERVAPAEGRPHVFVDYAHSADALKNVLRSLNELRVGFPGRIVTVFGCGGDRDRTKRPQMARVVSSLSDVTIGTSDNPRTEDPNAILDELETGIDLKRTHYLREESRRSAIRLALTMAKPEDIILIAGKGHENYQILGTETVHFDDAEEVRNFYANPSPG